MRLFVCSIESRIVKSDVQLPHVSSQKDFFGRYQEVCWTGLSPLIGHIGFRFGWIPKFVKGGKGLLWLKERSLLSLGSAFSMERI